MKTAEGLNESAKKIHEINKEKGFWDKDRNTGELLMLVVSELGEALEAHRTGRFTDPGDIFDFFTSAYPSEDFEERIKDTFEDEIADSIIRLLDLSAGLGIDIERHIRAKVIYNSRRERLHGKNY